MQNVRTDLRNIAIIAHVDHGKTTLVDHLLRQARVFRDNQEVGDLIMDSNPQERERGITILAKHTAVHFGDVTINIIDTPGHADFSGEVERVLHMADGALLLVDAFEGPMPQTRYVLRKALERDLPIVLVINKVDRPNARAAEVLEETHDLVLELATKAEHLEMPVVYTIAREGRAGTTPDVGPDLQPLIAAIVAHVPPPHAPDGPAQLLVANLDSDPHLGKIAIGRVARGRLVVGMPLARVRHDGTITRHKLTSLHVFSGISRLTVEEASAGDIVAMTGVEDAAIGETIADPAAPDALPPIHVEPPTVRMTFGVNTSPFAGDEGKNVTSRQLGERLFRELETNLGLRVARTDSPDVFEVSGRGELHLSVLIETLRREGFELQVSRPEAILHTDDAGNVLEPVELLVVDCTESEIGTVTQLVSERLGRMQGMHHDQRGGVRMEFKIPTRGLIGLRNALLTATRGNAVVSSLLLGLEPYQGGLRPTRSGALVASDTGEATTHGLNNAQQRGATFIEPGERVYAGMVVGSTQREQDLVVNVVREKKQTNIRSSTSDIAVRLDPPVRLSLEQSLDFIENDELVEVTPRSIRIRKRILDHELRAKTRKAAEAQRSG